MSETNQAPDAPQGVDENGDTASAVEEETYEFEQRDAKVKAGAGRPPTPDEEAAAERAAEQVDFDEVALHEKEMLRRGAGTKGEGRVP